MRRRRIVLVLLVGCGSSQPTAPPATAPPIVAQAQAQPTEAALPSPAEPPPEEHDDDEELPRYVAMPDAPPPAMSAAPPVNPIGPTPAEARACAARGGKIEPVCMLGDLECVVRFRDGGKRCTDGRQCMGDCLYEGPHPPTGKPVGACQRTSDPCGCKAPMVNGKVRPPMCGD